MSAGLVDHTAQSVAEMLRLHAHDDCDGKYLDTHACNIAAVFVEAQAARNAELEARLELVPGLSQSADGIACRDDTIRLQDEQIASLRAQLAGARETQRRLMNDLQAHKDALAQSEPYGRQSELRPGFYEDDME